MPFLSFASVLACVAGCGGPSATPEAPAQATVSAGSVSFPSALVGSTASTQTITLGNAGALPLLIAGETLSDTADFSVASTCSGAVQPASSCSLVLSFHPQSAGPLQATLTVADNSGGASSAQQIIGLSGNGAPVPEPQAVFSALNLAFPSTEIGTSSTPQTLSLTNGGTAPLAITGALLSDMADFSLSAGCGGTLAPGASCGIAVSLKPQVVGPVQGTLTLTTNSGGAVGQQVIALSGTGTPVPVSQAVFSVGSLSFPQTVLNAAATPQTVILSNLGEAPLGLGSTVLSDPVDFGLTTTCPASLAPTASCTLTLTFHPGSVADLAASLTLTDNSGLPSGSTQQVIALRGTGGPVPVPQAVLSVSTLSFQPTLVDASSGPQTVTLSNPGTAPLTLGSIVVNGSDPTAFLLGPTGCGVTLAAGGTCTETITYAPTLATAADSATLVFTDTAGNLAGAVQTVSLSGKALAEVDSITNFGDSITCGFYAQPNDGTDPVYSNEGYAGLFDGYVGSPATDRCRQGDTAADTARVWVPFFSTPALGAHQLYTLMIGVNDAYRYGTAPAALKNYVQEVGAALAWLALPQQAKVLANAITQRTGSWSADTGFGLQDFGLNSTDPGASLTFTVNQAEAGHSLYVVYHAYDLPSSQAGTATLSVDGVQQATVDESENSGYGPETQNSTNDSYLLKIVPLGAVGSHTVTFTSTGPAGAMVSLLWAGVPQTGYPNVAGAPRVLVGAITNSPSGNQTATAGAYNLQLRSLVASLAADGMNVTVVPTDTLLDPATDFADLLHPNNAGHAKLAAAFEQYR